MRLAFSHSGRSTLRRAERGHVTPQADRGAALVRSHSIVDGRGSYPESSGTPRADAFLSTMLTMSEALMTALWVSYARETGGAGHSK